MIMDRIIIITMYMGTIVSGYSQEFAQTCVSINMSGHKRVVTSRYAVVWAQTCGYKQVCCYMGTIVSSPMRLAGLVYISESPP